MIGLEEISFVHKILKDSSSEEMIKRSTYMVKIMTFACRYLYLTLWWLLLSSAYKNLCVCVPVDD